MVTYNRDNAPVKETEFMLTYFIRSATMKKVKNITIIILLAVGLFTCMGHAQTKSASTLLQEGLYAEEVDGNVDAAIKIYQQIIDDKAAQKSHVAQAMYRQGMCYLKKQDEQKAQEVFAKLVADYSDQTNIIEKVQPLLEEIGNADPAALMPAGTLVYAELGSPGRQIETIMNMLKGTPLENPLAMIGGNQQGQSSGQMNPANMLSAMMNPSMMAEFKKIRGFGFGICGLPQNDEDPPAIAVLFPGKSDALRGMLHAALGMAGQPTEAIEGMQCLALPGGAGAAFDDNVVIVASPKAAKAGQLAWSVKQYKSVIKEPTLATSNESFVKIDKRQRQENALTIWANVDEIYANLAGMFPSGSLPGEILLAEGIVDFENIDDLITTLSLNVDGIALKTDVSFKDGHNCLAYGMIHTPNLSKSGFEAVPADAVGIFSFALADSESMQAQAASQQIQNMTGLDIGREIFANIEQVTLFVMPPDAAVVQANTVVPPIVNRFGLAITSHNPQQTRQVLTRFLSVANLISSQAGGDQPVDETGKYQIALVNGQKIFCYMNQSSKTTVVSLNPDIVETSIATAGNRRSIMSAGPLRDSVDKLSPSTSKLILVNVGGAIKLAAANINFGPVEATGNLQELFGQLAEACSQTTIQVRTDEKLNNLSIITAVNNIPEMNKVFVPMMQLMQILEAQKFEQKARKKMAMIPANISKAPSTPVIDGDTDKCWDAAQRYDLKNSLYESPSSESDCSAFFKALWDKDSLYVLVNVNDENLRHDSDDFYQDDAVEIFIDADNSKSDSYGDNDFHYYFRWDKSSPAMGEYNGKSDEGVEFAVKTTNSGYVTEIKFPWTSLKVQPKPGLTIGFDVQVNDDDDGGDRDSKLAWCSKQDNAWENPGVFGNAQVTGLVGWWKFDETEGSNADDSSDNNNTGQLVGNPKWRPSGGKIGGALEFDGNGGYVDFGKSSVFNIAGQITVSTWIKVNGFSSDYAAIITKGDNAWRLQRNAETNGLEFACSGLDVPGREWCNIFGDVNVNDGQWHHAAGVYDGKQIYLYVDGKLDDSVKATGCINITDSPVYVSNNSDYEGRCWNGLVDDVRIYNYALSEDEIKALQK